MGNDRPTILSIEAPRQLDVQELKRVVRCSNPVTGRSATACYMVADGKRELSFSTADSRLGEAAGAALCYDVDASAWSGSRLKPARKGKGFEWAEIDPSDAAELAARSGLAEVAISVTAVLISEDAHGIPVVHRKPSGSPAPAACDALAALP